MCYAFIHNFTKGFIMIYLGSHVGMGGKEMFLGSVKEALSYGANTFMVYTGAPQNTRRKDVDQLRIDEAHALMKEAGITQFIVHAPYIINLANTVKPETFELAVEFLKLEIERTAAMGSRILVLHPGSHVEAGVEAGTAQIIKGLNMVLTADTPVYIALETMAGKGSEIGRTFEELKAIYDGVEHPEKLRVCMDTLLQLILTEFLQNLTVLLVLTSLLPSTLTTARIRKVPTRIATLIWETATLASIH